MNRFIAFLAIVLIALGLGILMKPEPPACKCKHAVACECGPIPAGCACQPVKGCACNLGDLDGARDKAIGEAMGAVMKHVDAHHNTWQKEVAALWVRDKVLHRKVDDIAKRIDALPKHHPDRDLAARVKSLEEFFQGIDLAKWHNENGGYWLVLPRKK